MDRIAIVLPTLNEEQGIATMIYDVKKVMPLGGNIIVVDSNSEDRTRSIANNMGAKIRLAPRGKGAAICSVWQELCDYNYAVMLDADGTYPARYIPHMLSFLIEHDYDVVTGYRVWNTESMSIVHSFGNKALTFLANTLYPVKTADLCTGYWAFSQKAMRLIELTARRFELEANLFSEVNRNNLKLVQTPIEYQPRVGQGKLRMRDGFEIVMKLITERIK